MNRVLALWGALDEGFERVQAVPWGAVVTDPRFPQIWDVNYARVESEDPALRLEDIEAFLEPALQRAGAVHRHVVLFHPEPLSSILVAASSRGARLSWEDVMVLESPPLGEERSDVSVCEVHQPDGDFFRTVRRSLAEFEVHDPTAADQLMRIEQEVLSPAGKRWFGIGDPGRESALGSLILLGDVGLIDHIVTFPPARRRGYAEAIVRRIVAEAFEAGASALTLLAEPSGSAQRLYERLGFRTVGTIASTIERR